MMLGSKWQKGYGGSATVPPSVGGSNLSNSMGPTATELHNKYANAIHVYIEYLCPFLGSK